MKKVKLLIAVPCYDTAEAGFLKCFADLLMHLNKEGYDFDVKVERATLVYLARENLAIHAIHNSFTHVLWLDTDQVFEPDIVDRMLALEKPFVAAAIRGRHGKHAINISLSIRECEPIEELPKEPFWAEACGFGTVLIETKVMQAVRHAHGTCFEPTYRMGEDFQFCQKALSCGYKVYCDPSIKVGHISRYTIWPDNIDLLREYEKQER